MCGESIAQTDYSFRIRSMGTSFAGIVDDYLSDVYLNPARAGDIDGTMLYGTWLPSRSLTSSYPYQSNFFYSTGVVPREVTLVSTSTAPLAVSYLDSRRSGSAFLIAAEAYVSGSDRTDSRPSTRFLNSSVESVEDNDFRSSDVMHARVDVVMGQKGTKSPFGVRISGTYDHNRPGSADYRNTTNVSLTAPGEVSRRTEAFFQSADFEQMRLTASAGIHRSDAWVSDVVVGGGLRVEKLDTYSSVTSIYDSDADKNGQDANGGAVNLEFDEGVYESSRDYSGFTVFGRVHLDHSPTMRSTHRVSWVRLSGDGPAFHSFESTEAGFVDRMTVTRFAYDYEGTRSEVRAESMFGYHESITDDVLFAAGLHGVYERSELDEPGTGEVRVTNSGVDNPINGVAVSPYAQLHDNAHELFEIVVPAALEWSVHEFVSLRLGAAFVLLRQDGSGMYAQEVLALGGQSVFPIDARVVSLDNDVVSSTTITYSNGLGINIKDRVVIDLLVTGSLDFTSYSFLSARFHF
jgi:hypothetical protein